MYTLYTFSYSQHSRRVVSLLEAAALPYKIKIVDLVNGGHMADDYLKINPNHQVPTLIDGELILHESHAIMRYLCNKHDLTGWYPQDATKRAKVDQWLDWTQCLMSPAVVDIVLNKVFMGPNGDSVAIEKGCRAMGELALLIETQLNLDEFIAGTQPTIADLALVSNIFQLGLAEEIPNSPALLTWYDRMLSMECVVKSLPGGV